MPLTNDEKQALSQKLLNMQAKLASVHNDLLWGSAPNLLVLKADSLKADVDVFVAAFSRDYND